MGDLVRLDNISYFTVPVARRSGGFVFPAALSITDDVCWRKKKESLYPLTFGWYHYIL
jgi:hypothetical protein